MATTDKEVRVTVKAGDFGPVRRQIQELTRDVQKLVEAASKAGGLLGGMGSGVCTIAGRSGTSAGTQISSKIAGSPGGASGGLLGGLASGTTGVASVFKSAAEGSKASFKVMSDGLKGLVNAGDSEVRRLEGVFGRLNRMFRSGGQGGGASAADFGPGGVYDPKKKKGESGWLSQMATAAGLPGWMVGGAGVAMGVGSVLAAGNMMLGGYAAAKRASLNYDIASPMFASNMGAEAGSVFGGQSLALRQGNLALSYAMTQTSTRTKKDVPSQQEYVASKGMKDHLEELRQMSAPVTLKGNILSAPGGVGAVGAYKFIADGVAAGIKSIVTTPLSNTLKGLAGAVVPFYNPQVMPVGSPQQLAKRTLDVQQANAQVMMSQEVNENYQKTHPLLSNQMNEFYGGALGDIGLSRAAGISGSFVKHRDGSVSDSVADFNQRAMNMGISGGELAGYRQQMGATAGRGFFYKGGALLGPQAGGLSNVANILGVGAQFGKGGGWAGGNAFLQNIQSMIGRGGVDVTAGGQVAGLGMAGMTSGNFGGTTGQGLMSTLLTAAYTGTTGGDMRMARMLPGGMNAMNALMSGKLDPVQGALNWSSAVRAGRSVGGVKLNALRALTKMDAATRYDIGGDANSPISSKLRVQGVTHQLVAEYIRNQNASIFARVIPGTLSKEQDAAVRAFRAAGNSMSFLKGMSAKDQDAAMWALGTADTAGQMGTTDEDRFAQFATMAAHGGYLRDPHGRGARNPASMKNPRGAAIRDLAHARAKTGRELAEWEDKHKGLTVAIGSREANEEAALKAAAKAAAAAEKLGPQVDDLNGAINNISQALTAFVTQLHQTVGGSASGPN